MRRNANRADSRHGKIPKAYVFEKQNSNDTKLIHASLCFWTVQAEGREKVQHSHVPCHICAVLLYG